MITNQAAINIIKSHEGLSLVAYLCPAEKWTIGYGHTGKEVVKGLKITAEKAEELLKRDLAKFENYVDKYVKVALTENEFSALVSFTYNVGPGNFKDSTLLKKLNKGDHVGAASEFNRWIYAKKKPLNGLIRRRRDEMNLFLKD